MDRGVLDKIPRGFVQGGGLAKLCSRGIRDSDIKEMRVKAVHAGLSQLHHALR